MKCQAGIRKPRFLTSKRTPVGSNDLASLEIFPADALQLRKIFNPENDEIGISDVDEFSRGMGTI